MKHSAAMTIGWNCFVCGIKQSHFRTSIAFLNDASRLICLYEALHQKLEPGINKLLAGYWKSREVSRCSKPGLELANAFGVFDQNFKLTQYQKPSKR